MLEPDLDVPLSCVVSLDDGRIFLKVTPRKLGELLARETPKPYIVVERTMSDNPCFAQASWEPGTWTYTVEYRDASGHFQTVMDRDQALNFFVAWVRDDPHWKAAPHPWVPFQWPPPSMAVH